MNNRPINAGPGAVVEAASPAIAASAKTSSDITSQNSIGGNVGTELQVMPKNAELSRYMPVMSMDEAVQRREVIVQATARLMKRDIDYGMIPGTKKDTLLQPGADKLCNLFGLTPTFERVSTVTDWTGEDHGGEAFISYEVKCKLYRGDYLIAEGEGSCNSWEVKYRYRWMSEDEARDSGRDLTGLRKKSSTASEFEFAIQKRETGGKYGKPAEYWQKFTDAIESGAAVKIQRNVKSGGTRPAWEIASTVYRVPNPEICDEANTILKMANKRAKIAATINATSASEFFTQDMEDRTEAALSPTYYDNPVPDEVTEAKAEEQPVQSVRLAAWQVDLYNRASTFKQELGESEYRQVLGNYGRGHINEVPTRLEAIEVLRAMKERLNDLKLHRLLDPDKTPEVSDAFEQSVTDDEAAGMRK